MLLKAEDLRKELVRRAKQRMLRGDYEAVAAAETNLAEDLTDDRIVKYADIVRNIKESEKFVVDPMRRMMDKNYYDRLDEDGKSRYILELSKIYCELKRKI